MAWGGLTSALGCFAFNLKAWSVGLWQICNVATLPGDSFAWQQVGHLQCQCSVGRLASLKCWISLTVQCWSMVRLVGAADFQHLAVARSVLQARPAIGTLCRLVWLGSLWPVSWGGLTSALGCFSNCSVGLWQICNVATLPGDSFAWQQVGNLQCQCSMGRLASSKCWICLPVQCWSMVRLAGAADFQHLAVARSAFFQDLQLDLCADSAGQGVARSVLPQDPVGMLQPCQVTALLGKKLETCSVSAACSMGRTVQHG